MKTKVFCPDCGQYVPIKIKERTVVTDVKDLTIQYDEQYAICKKCHNEIFLYYMDDINCYRRFTAYEKAKNKA